MERNDFGALSSPLFGDSYLLKLRRHLPSILADWSDGGKAAIRGSFSASPPPFVNSGASPPSFISVSWSERLMESGGLWLFRLSS